ncbi:phage filamentation protein Fil family protein [Yersinia rohdei]|uniref:phage filamentation protein Fil family protein n=1 Tax=Yersinia rohdei TaxID=29485 RepID=UPI0011A39490|nr:phage filamentation protein Fil family protein [Yersinia rohdei]
MTQAPQCPSLAALLVNGQKVTHYRHQRGWLETPDGRHFQPKASEVQFIPGLRTPYMAKPKAPRRWFSRLMGIFA